MVNLNFKPFPSNQRGLVQPDFSRKGLQGKQETSDKMGYKTGVSVKPWNQMDFKETEQLLLSSEITKTATLYKYLNIQGRRFNPTASLLFFDSGLKAVFKPGRSFRNAMSALMAYRFSQFMNFGFVPPTVIRKIDGETGPVRLFIEHTDELQYKFVRNLSPAEKSDIYTFYFVLGEHDANKYNVLFETDSCRPVLVDNETCMTTPFIPYGDYPFRSLKIKSKRVSVSSPEDWQDFPLKEVKELNDYSPACLKKILYDMDEMEFNRYFIPWCIKRHKFLNGCLSFVKWRNAYWVRKNFMYYTQIYKNFLPTIFSKKTMERLKKLNEKTLADFLPDYLIPKAVIFGILHRRGIILKTAGELDRFCP